MFVELHYITLHYYFPKNLYTWECIQKSLHLGVYPKIFTLGSVYIVDIKSLEMRSIVSVLQMIMLCTCGKAWVRG